MSRSRFAHARHFAPTFTQLLIASAFLAWVAIDPLAAGFWSTTTSLPVAVQEVSVTALNGHVYVVGGSRNQTRVNTVYVLDPTAATPMWTTKAPYPGTARDHIGIAALGNFLYLVGGVSQWPSPSVTTVQRYDPTTDAWTNVAPLPVARGATATAALDGKIYAAGGLVNGAAVSDFTVYNPVTNSWQTLPPMPTPRDHAAGVALGGKFYVTGGRTSSTCSPLTTVEVFDPSTSNWSTVAPMRFARGGHGAAAVNGKLYVFGGEGAPSTCGAIGSAEEYEPTANTWTDVPPMPTPRHGTNGAVIGSSIYVPGGGTKAGDAPTNVVEKLDTTATATVPAPWTSRDIGSVGLTGSANSSNGGLSVRGAGADIWGSADSFHFVYQPLTGDGQITARVASLQNTHVYAKAGVMLRGALTANAPHVILDVKPGGGLEFMMRSTAGGPTTFIGSANANAPVWLRLTRAGTTVIAAWSANGTTWSEVGRTTSSLPATVYAGLPVTSHTTTALTTAMYDNVRVETSPLPSPWANTNIGNVGLAGSASYAGGVFTIKGAGADIWGSADSFHFVHQPLAGDAQITARVASVQNTHVYAKAGVMLRGALTANAPHAILDVKPGGGLEFMTRSTAGGPTTFIGSASASAPLEFMTRSTAGGRRRLLARRARARRCGSG
jgi:N-acetylneuraminic acid mutarotase/regulation of enolase protein 1 (concanavalin A-like superfamily)